MNELEDQEVAGYELGILVVQLTKQRLVDAWDHAPTYKMLRDHTQKNAYRQGISSALACMDSVIEALQKQQAECN